MHMCVCACACARAATKSMMPMPLSGTLSLKDGDEDDGDNDELQLLNECWRDHMSRASSSDPFANPRCCMHANAASSSSAVSGKYLVSDTTLCEHATPNQSRSHWQTSTLYVQTDTTWSTTFSVTRSHTQQHQFNICVARSYTVKQQNTVHQYNISMTRSYTIKLQHTVHPANIRAT